MRTAPYTPVEVLSMIYLRQLACIERQIQHWCCLSIFLCSFSFPLITTITTFSPTMLSLVSTFWNYFLVTTPVKAISCRRVGISINKTWQKLTGICPTPLCRENLPRLVDLPLVLPMVCQGLPHLAPLVVCELPEAVSTHRIPGHD